MWDLKKSPCKYNIYDHDGHQLVKCRPVLGVALVWLPNPGKLLACGGTNWTQVSVRFPNQNYQCLFCRQPQSATLGHLASLESGEGSTV